MSGWIKLHRQLTEWEWYTDANTVRLFIHCLFKANHESKKWRGITVKRGQFIASYEGLGNELALSRQKIRTSIGKLAATNEVITKSSLQHTVFTVINYDTYQGDNPTATNEITNVATNEQPTSNHPITTTKECKNERSIKPIVEYSDEDMRLAEWIYERVLIVAPKTKKPKMGKWAEIVYMMVSSDGHTHREIAEVFQWANNDVFWKTNILSPAKLRKKFSELHSKMGNQHETNQRSSQSGMSTVEQVAATALANRESRAGDRGDMEYFNGDLRFNPGETVRETDAGGMDQPFGRDLSEADARSPYKNQG